MSLLRNCLSALAARAGLIDPLGKPIDTLGLVLRRAALEREQREKRPGWGMDSIHVFYFPERQRYRMKMCDGPLEDHPEMVWGCSLGENCTAFWGRTPEEAVQKALGMEPPT